MMNSIKQIFSHKLRLSGIRGCMAAGAVTAGIAALAVIGGVNSEDISTVNLETDVIPEETVAETVTEKKTYSHDMEYFSSEDLKKITSKREEPSETAAEMTEETAAVNEAANEPAESVESPVSEEAADIDTNDTDEDAEAAVSEENEDSTASSEEQETASEEEAPSEEAAPEEETDSEESSCEADEDISDDEYSEDISDEASEDMIESTEEYPDSTDNAPEQTEETEETTGSVFARISAAGGDDDNGGLSSALDIETENEAEAPVMAAAAPENTASAAVYTAEEETDEETDGDFDLNDIPEDITLDDEDETEPAESTPAPQEGAISQFELPQWLTFDENGLPTEYVNVLTGNACAYTAAPDALMSTGKEVFQGYVAVDPDIIPYGSELYIVAEDGEVYGYAIAADTGGSVRRGEIIVDLFMNEYDDCIQWGNKPVYVYVLK